MRKRLPDEEARRRFERLFERHRRPVLGYALRRVHDPADAADVLAATFLVAWRRIEDVPSGEDARPWLLAVARRTLANERRGERRRDALTERLGHELALRVPAGEHTERSGSEAARVWPALARLSDEDREVLLLAGWEGLAPAEIAVVLGMRPVTARSRLHRARRRLRSELAAGDGEDARRTGPASRVLEPATEEIR